ncbi:DUF805 domain-containing protein [Methanolapillus ohkumae]|uniref:DUF805 domain-containing protein n=1 Tax=Methanolapillus ohkumae TaxID=3028298 RepID=A0AA96V7J1_9EURY|nr:hypothetical protein MsAm2_10580 [Methanosarcinaceae archaeon Am2]
MELFNFIAETYTYEGRLNRMPYILMTIGFWILIAINTLFYISSISFVDSHEFNIGGILILVFIFADMVIILFITVFIFFQTIRRLHDMNQSGWLCLIKLLYIIPFLNIVAILFDIILFIFDGTVGPNQYGEDPKGRIPEFD